MAAIYSQTLWRVVDNGTTGSNVLGPVVPDGYVWLIRRCSIWNDEDVGMLTGVKLGALVEDDAEVYYAEFRDQIGISAEVLYERETRRVLEAGRQLFAYTVDGGWSWEVTGWALVAP